MRSTEITCRELLGFIDDYLDGRLAESSQLAFEAHLAVCPQCVAYLEGYRASVALSGRAFDPDGPPPGDVPEELVRAILALRRSP